MIFRTYKTDKSDRLIANINWYSFIFGLFVFFIFSMNTFSLDQKQAQDIRFAKAMTLVANQEEKEALRYLRKNLSGPFHFETEKYLAQYFFDKREFTKSFRLYQHMLKNTYSKEVVNYTFDTKLRDNFVEFLKKKKAPSPLSLTISFQVAQKYYDAFKLKVFPEEFSKNLLELSEKYFTICLVNNMYLAPTKFYLSKIYFERKQNKRAIILLREAKSDYSLSPEKNLELDLKIEDIELLLGESLAREGHTDSSVLLIRSLYAREGISSNTKNYAKTFLDELNTSFFNTIFTYQIKQKNNIHQLPVDSYNDFSNLPNSNELGKKDSLVHHRRFNFYMNQQINKKIQASANFTYINEKPLDDSIKGPGFEQTSLELELKKYRQQSSFYGIGYRFNNLAGRNLSSLQFIQATSSHTFLPHYYWLTDHSKWRLTAPLEFRGYKNERKANSLGIQLNYQPILDDSWWSPSLFGTIGRRSEGESYPSSFFYQLGLMNTQELGPRWLWLLTGDFYSNSNSEPLLSYSELTLSSVFTYQFKSYKDFQLELDFQWRQRNQESFQTISSLDLGAGISYNF